MKITSTDWKPLGRHVSMACFAIGDVHGHAKHLSALYDRISAIIEGDRLDQAAVIQLGDLIDRGPDSLRAIDLAMKGPEAENCKMQTIQLCGNHEQMLLHVLHSGFIPADEAWNLWIGNGGWSVLDEMKISRDRAIDDPAGTKKAVLEGLGSDRVAFLDQMLTSAELDTLLFVHAGVYPDAPLDDTLTNDWTHFPTHRTEHLSPFWVRDVFLNHNAPLASGHLVVHGHTIERNAGELHPHRLGLDAGSFRTGKVMCAEFRDDQYRLHTAEARI